MGALGRALNGCLELEPMLQHITDAARELSGADLAAIALRDGGSEALIRRHHSGFIETDGNGRVRSSLAILAVAIRGRDRIEGALYVARGGGVPYTGHDEAILSRVAGEAAVAIHRVRVLEAARAAVAEAERASRTKDEFLAMVSHELRTPVTAVLGWLRLLREGRLAPPTAARALEAIRRSSEVQVRLVNDLLDISRIVAGTLYLDVRHVDLADIVRGAVDAIRWSAEAKGVRVETALEPAVGSVVGDPIRLHQIATNLLTNALNSTPGGGRIAVTLARGRGTARLQVSDTGAGIEPGVLPRIFDRFWQAKEAPGRRREGLGLGLAIVRHLTELHGGRVGAESAGKGRGATFTVELPLAVMSGSASRPPISIGAETRPSSPGPARLDAIGSVEVSRAPSAPWRPRAANGGPSSVDGTSGR